jgi:Na+/melibiose symporter-like transporter
MLVIVYLIMCFMIGIAGRRRALGFFGFFLLSVILTPVIMLGWLLITHRRFLGREVAGGHFVMCADCAAVEARDASAAIRHCARCGAPV